MFENPFEREAIQFYEEHGLSATLARNLSRLYYPFLGNNTLSAIERELQNSAGFMALAFLYLLKGEHDKAKTNLEVAYATTEAETSRVRIKAILESWQEVCAAITKVKFPLDTKRIKEGLMPLDELLK